MPTRPGLLALPLILAMAAPASPAFAMGNEIPAGFEWDARLADPALETLEIGRLALRKKVTCKKCPFPDGVNDRATAIEVILMLEAGKIKLNRRKAGAVAYFLHDRFDIFEPV